MSYRQCISVSYPVNPDKFLEILQKEFGARENPHQPGTYVIGETGLPFYKPWLMDDHLTISGFNRAPLPSELIEALLNHPALVPETAIMRWTEEQELLTAGSLESLKRRSRGKER